MPSVVLVSDYGQVHGGAEQVALATARLLADAGHPVRFVCGTAPSDARLDGVPTHSLGVREEDLKRGVKGLAHFVSNPAAAALIGRALEGLDPRDTIVHFHSFATILTPAALAAALDRGFTTVVTAHDYGLACPNSGFYVHPKREICHRKPLGIDCLTTQCSRSGPASKAALAFRSALFRGTTRRRLRHVVSVSAFSRDILQPYLSPDVHGRVIVNPTDLTPRPRIAVEQNSEFVFVGRLSPEKDPALLARAGRLSGLPVLFVGDGPEAKAVRAELPNAFITGWQDAAGVDAHLARARAMVLTSRWYEAAPLVTVEALSRGIPVLVPDTCAAQEFLEEDGLLFRSGSAESLADAMRTLADPATGRRMSEHAYARPFARAFSSQAHLTSLLEFYAEALRIDQGEP